MRCSFKYGCIQIVLKSDVVSQSFEKSFVGAEIKKTCRETSLDINLMYLPCSVSSFVVKLQSSESLDKLFNVLRCSRKVWQIELSYRRRSAKN